MFYATRSNDHGLPYDPFKAIVAPRPIGWITSISARGEVNLAPYSFFNGVSTRPPIVIFSSEGKKDSLALAEETGEFVCNLATWDLREAMNLTSAPFPRGVDEMRQAGLTPAPSRLVKPPRVAEAPCALECKWLQTVTLRDTDGRSLDRYVAFGQVVGVHIDDRFISNGLLDTAAMKPIARCGYNEYAVVEAVFSMVRPETADVNQKSDVGNQRPERARAAV
ncbi:MAG TPA: flavin reductase family protein [Xanthobacteraceae bacterium]|nr:flavin reductase family protein [Xanthobacteraceae bacterium]